MREEASIIEAQADMIEAALSEAEALEKLTLDAAEDAATAAAAAATTSAAAAAAAAADSNQLDADEGDEASLAIEGGGPLEVPPPPAAVGARQAGEEGVADAEGADGEADAAEDADMSDLTGGDAAADDDAPYAEEAAAAVREEYERTQMGD